MHGTLHITLDDPIMHDMIIGGDFNDDSSKMEKQCIKRRAGNYLMDDGQLFHKATAKYEVPRLVPAIAERENIIAKSHNNFGHFGIGMTTSLLQQQFYWSNMTQDVKNCLTCQV